jgi:hypothetical protein
MRDQDGAMSSRDDVPGMPRDPQIHRRTRDEDQALHAARERVILEQLLTGDTRGLANLLLEGHIPGPTIRQCLALMLLDWPEADAAVAAKPALNQELWRLPFRLVARARPRRRSSRGRGKKAGASVDPAENVSRLVEELSYDAAIARVDEAVLSLIKTGRND